MVVYDIIVVMYFVRRRRKVPSAQVVLPGPHSAHNLWQLVAHKRTPPRDPREDQTLPETCTRPREVYICKRLRKIEIKRPREVEKVKKSIQGAEEEKI